MITFSKLNKPAPPVPEPDKFGRTPCLHNGRACEGWQASVYGGGKPPEQGFHGPRKEHDTIMRVGISDGGEPEPYTPPRQSGPRMGRRKRQAVEARAQELLKRKGRSCH